MGDFSAMSNLPAPIDPNLLPAVQHGLRLPYSQDIFLLELELAPLASSDFVAAVPDDFVLELRLDGERIVALTEGGTALGQLQGQDALLVLRRLLEAGKRLTGKFRRPQRVAVWFQEL